MVDIDYPALIEQMGARHEQYVTADPFPHAVIEGIFDLDFLRRVAAEFSDPTEMEQLYDLEHERYKSTERNWANIGPHGRELFGELNSGSFLEAMTALTGIPDLVADAQLEGGGLHQTTAGGFLSIHADFNKHRATGLDRRLNAIVYLNEGWDDAWGGHLELWQPDMSRCVKRIAPRLGTTVVFSTTSNSYHGHPDPITCPPGVVRRSVAVFYYTNGRPADEVHDSHTSLFQTRPNSRADKKAKLVRIVRRSMPPALWDAMLAARERRKGR